LNYGNIAFYPIINYDDIKNIFDYENIENMKNFNENINTTFRTLRARIFINNQKLFSSIQDILPKLNQLVISAKDNYSEIKNGVIEKVGELTTTINLDPSIDNSKESIKFTNNFKDLLETHSVNLKKYNKMLLSYYEKIQEDQLFLFVFIFENLNNTGQKFDQLNKILHDLNLDPLMFDNVNQMNKDFLRNKIEAMNSDNMLVKNLLQFLY
jgi:hypothetical protein